MFGCLPVQMPGRMAGNNQVHRPTGYTNPLMGVSEFLLLSGLRTFLLLRLLVSRQETSQRAYRFFNAIRDLISA